MNDIHTILVTGSDGQLGQSIQRLAIAYPQYDFKFVNRAELDLNDKRSIDQYFSQNQVELVINCAAYTAVDKAEAEPEIAEQINHLAVKQLAELIAEQGAKLIHISTDYVFNGQHYQPYSEVDNTAPQSIYGSTKLKGELALLQAMQTNAVIIRTSWLYCEYGNNFVKTMVKLAKQRDSLGVICDQIGSPTYAYDLAKAIMTIITDKQFNQPFFTSEVFHYSNEGVCSWYDFALAIFELAGISCHVSAIETKDYPCAARRPYYSVLNKAKIKQSYLISIPHWKQSLVQCLIQLPGEQ